MHHALCAVVCPIFDAGFIANSYANRNAKGTHCAIAAYERYRDRHAHVRRCDLFRYFPSTDHTILKAEFRRRIACEQTLALMDLIVDGSNAEEPVELYFPGDDLFEPFGRRRGLRSLDRSCRARRHLAITIRDVWRRLVRSAPQKGPMFA